MARHIPLIGLKMSVGWLLGLFRSKRTRPFAEDAVLEIYGDRPPRKDADLSAAITLAYEQLLAERIPLQEVERLTTNLFNGPMPFSTHDLAASSALAFFQTPKYFSVLSECQIDARRCILDWLKAGEITPTIGIVFEETLYRDYKPFLIT